MKNAFPLGNGTLLPSTETRKHKNAQSLRSSKQQAGRVVTVTTRRTVAKSAPPIPPPPVVPEAPAEPAHALPTLGEIAWQNRAWPRGFDLPCLEKYRTYTAEALVSHLALTFHGIEAQMHELVHTLAQARPAEAAALAEAVAILEQCACMEGLATALDDIPCNKESPTLRLAALAKVQALNRRHE